MKREWPLASRLEEKENSLSGTCLWRTWAPVIARRDLGPGMIRPAGI